MKKRKENRAFLTTQCVENYVHTCSDDKICKHRLKYDFYSFYTIIFKRGSVKSAKFFNRIFILLHKRMSQSM